MAHQKKISGKAAVDQYLEVLQHPFKSEIERLREIILSANSHLCERIKWNAPSFYFQRDMAAFNLRARGFVQLIFIFYEGTMIESPILLGKWKDRREVRFYHMDDVVNFKGLLQKVVNEWVDLTITAEQNAAKKNEH